MIKEVVVLSPSFSRNRELRMRAVELFERVRFNESEMSLNEEGLIRLIGNADAVIVGLEKLTKKIFQTCKNLKCISKYGVGLDNIDPELFKAHNIDVLYSGGVNKRSVAEHTIAKMISLCHNFPETTSKLKRGEWKKSGGFELCQKKVALIGLGNIGLEVARLLKVFDVHLSYFDTHRNIEQEQSLSITYERYPDVLINKDIVSIHASLNPSSYKMIGEREISMMQNGVIIVNTARADIIDCDVLRNEIIFGERIGAVALDVFHKEPYHDAEFLRSDKVLCTPHIAGNTKEAVLRMGHAAIDNLIAYS